MDIIKKFNSVAEFSAYLNGSPTEAFSNKQDSISGSEKFTGTANYEEADNLLKYGDRKSFEMIKESTRQIKASGKGRRNELYTAICGVTPNVPAYLAGSPAAMVNTRKKPVKTKVITIYYDCGASCATKKEDLAKAAAAMLQNVCDIENAGIRVNFNIMWNTSQKSDHKGQQVCICVCVKRAEERIDPLKIAYPAVNPSFLRRHCFRGLEVTNGVNESFKYGYGYSCGISDQIKKQFSRNGAAVFVSCEKIQRWIKAYGSDPTGYVYEEIHDQLETR